MILSQVSPPNLSLSIFTNFFSITPQCHKKRNLFHARSHLCNNLEVKYFIAAYNQMLIVVDNWENEINKEKNNKELSKKLKQEMKKVRVLDEKKEWNH
jgi:hypothetical protein